MISRPATAPGTGCITGGRVRRRRPAWAFRPTHDPAATWRTNVLGSIRVFEAVAAAEVPALVHASSVGAYSPGPKDHAVDESWPTHGRPDAAYCREKAYPGRALDTFAYRLAVRSDVRGAFNLAGEPPVDAEMLGGLLDARPVRLPRTAARSAIAAAWGLHLLPASPHLFDAVLRLPLMDCTRARTELGWRPEHSAGEVLEEFLRGMRQGAGARTVPMAGRKVG